MDSDYWNNVYKTKTEKEVSWFQEIPTTSLKLIEEIHPDTNWTIIDIGGGESRLVDHLLDRKFSDITVLDISSVSLDKVALRLKNKSPQVTLVSTNILNFHPNKQFDLWHDRAAFHFLTDPKDIYQYINLASNSIRSGGFLIISTFSKSGPEKCSGLPITKYSHDELIELFSENFINLKCFYETHETPWSSKQNFVFCIFKKI